MAQEQTVTSIGFNFPQGFVIRKPESRVLQAIKNIQSQFVKAGFQTKDNFYYPRAWYLEMAFENAAKNLTPDVAAKIVAQNSKEILVNEGEATLNIQQKVEFE